MKRLALHAAFVILLAIGITSCKEEKIEDKALIEDMPVGYLSEGEAIQARPKKFKAHGAEAEKDVEYFLKIEGAKGTQNEEPKDEMEAVDQDVKLYSWKSQPKTFVYLEDEALDKSKEKSK